MAGVLDAGKKCIDETALLYKKSFKLIHDAHREEGKYCDTLRFLSWASSWFPSGICSGKGGSAVATPLLNLIGVPGFVAIAAPLPATVLELSCFG